MNRISEISVEGIKYGAEDFTDREVLSRFRQRSAYHHQLYLFLHEWFSDSSSLRLHTSGSTGTPKEITAHKTQMLQSAKSTSDFFRLRKGDKALLCLPLDYIAGKMMVVRALYAGLDLYPVPPDGHPLSHTDVAFDFAAMVPLQVYNSLQSNEEKERLSRIRFLIIGGAAIDKTLENELRSLPNAIYATYGMTETLSHIALRKVNGPQASCYYTPFPSVGLSLSTDNRLIVNAPSVAEKTLITNDIAEIREDGSFRIIGRADNIINSGGIKIQIEEVERILQPHIRSRFAITAMPHPKLGEAVILIIESVEDRDYIIETIKQLLPRHQQPILVHISGSIPQTRNGKIDRYEMKELAKKINLSSLTGFYIH